MSSGGWLQVEEVRGHAQVKMCSLPGRRLVTGVYARPALLHGSCDARNLGEAKGELVGL